MSTNPIVDESSSSNLRRSSNDVLLKHVTLLNAQTQKTLAKLTIPKVLVLYTGSNWRRIFIPEIDGHVLGGTIGMKVLRNAYEPVTNFLPDALREMNIMHNVKYAETMEEIDLERSFLYLPLSVLDS